MIKWHASYWFLLIRFIDSLIRGALAVSHRSSLTFRSPSLSFPVPCVCPVSLLINLWLLSTKGLITALWEAQPKLWGREAILWSVVLFTLPPPYVYALWLADILAALATGIYMKGLFNTFKIMFHLPWWVISIQLYMGGGGLRNACLHIQSVNLFNKTYQQHNNVGM